jgi:RNA polymerase-binding transcription factor DksA
MATSSTKKAAKKAAPAAKATSKKAAAKKAAAGSNRKAPAKAASARTTKTAKKAPAAKKGTVATKAATSKKAPVKKRSGKLEPFHQEMQDLLLEERATYTQQADILQAEAEQLAAEREPGDVQFDEESGEGDTLAVERERDLALSAQARAAVEEIDEALERIVDGSYGICGQCGKNIPKERLRALPQAKLCVQCKSGGGFGRF